jgi:hypothetical protein
VHVLRVAENYTWVEVTLTEGRNRQIHRMFESVGLLVDKLSRVKFADMTVDTLRPGEIRELTRTEVAALRAATAVPSIGARTRAIRKSSASPRPRRTPAAAVATEDEDRTAPLGEPSTPEAGAPHRPAASGYAERRPTPRATGPAASGAGRARPPRAPGAGRGDGRAVATRRDSTKRPDTRGGSMIERGAGRPSGGGRGGVGAPRAGRPGEGAPRAASPRARSAPPGRRRVQWTDDLLVGGAKMAESPTPARNRGDAPPRSAAARTGSERGPRRGAPPSVSKRGPSRTTGPRAGGRPSPVGGPRPSAAGGPRGARPTHRGSAPSTTRGRPPTLGSSARPTRRAPAPGNPRQGAKPPRSAPRGRR